MKKRIIRIGVIVFTVLCVATVQFNTVFGAQYAYSIGTDYSTLLNPDINTSGDATYAATAFGTAGYTSYYNVKPEVTYMRGYAPNGTKRLGSEVVFLSGHGNSQLMSFNYKNKDGDYATGIIQGKDWKSSSTGYAYAGVSSCNMSKTKLYVLAGCQTGAGSSNLTRDVVNNGADVAIGWLKSVGAGSHTAWLKRFCDKLATGSTVNNAKIYANSFTYADSDVKSAYTFGNLSLVIKTSKSNSVSLISDSRKVNIPKNIQLVQKNNKDELENVFKKAGIKENIADFIIRRNEDAVDLVYTINGVETLNGYTIITEGNNVSEIYNNMPINKKSYMLKNSFNIPVVSSKNKQDYLSKAQEKLSDHYTILDQIGKVILDAEKDTYFYYVVTDYKVNDDGALGRSEEFYEIN